MSNKDENGWLSPKEVYQSSINALKHVYYVLITLVIINAFQGTISIENNSLNLEWNALIMLLSLLFTVVRFLHGASIHLNIKSEKPKVGIDYISFLIQGSLFYVMSISLKNPILFSLAYVCLVIADIFWIILMFLGKVRACKWVRECTELQWLFSDIFITILLIPFIIFLINNPEVKSTFSVIYIFIISLGMLIFDYCWNVHFYFPHKMGKALLNNQICIYNENEIIKKLNIKSYKNNKKIINSLIKNLDEKALREMNV